ncbi:MAG: glycine betaine/L-proline ABC transporter ATP-binding protein [Atopostipes suicloacalis]|nr:glycine betaine/L-proline ABC transporter ATP-binding protein [Atopostipes suicloacalis]MDN6731422.1 glycine betaine/L-proline ABC transporter ATP-binding protein [Atopostipes suicloacalis]
MTKKLTIENLTKIFGGNKKEALELTHQGKLKKDILEETGATVGVYDANFEVNEGEVFVIMGLSGSGKSTLVRMLNRLIEPTEGIVKIDGENIMDMDEDELREVRRKKVSMVFQNFGLFPHKTILENTVYGLEVQGINKKERLAQAEKALDNAGLLAYKDQYPDQLSGGMQQRVGLARALANDPEIILMDEAFSALDPLIRRDMQDELIELQKNQERTIVFITHDLNESLRLGDRIAIMKDGEVVQVDTGEEILMNPADDYVKRFVEDIDRSKVFTAENIMSTTPEYVTIGKTDPQTTLEQMYEKEISNIIVVDENKALKGYVEEKEVADAVRDGVTELESLIHKDIPKVRPTTLVANLYDIIHDVDTPVAVVNEDDELLGIIVRGAIISALSEEGREEVLNN